jgi:hypothetical protein
VQEKRTPRRSRGEGPLRIQRPVCGSRFAGSRAKTLAMQIWLSLWNWINNESVCRYCIQILGSKSRRAIAKPKKPEQLGPGYFCVLTRKLVRPMGNYVVAAAEKNDRTTSPQDQHQENKGL